MKNAREAASRQARGPLPDPIPASYYARPDGEAPPGTRTARTGDRPRGMSGVQDWPTRKRIPVAVACLLGAVSVIQAPWRPAVGLLGLVTLAMVVLATGAWGLPDRVPRLRALSALPLISWPIVGCLLLVTSAVCLMPLGSSLAAHRKATRTTASAVTAAPSAMPLGAVTSSPVALVPSPTTTPIHVRAPRHSPTSTPARTEVVLPNGPLSAHPGQRVTLVAQTAPNSQCSIDVSYPGQPNLGSVTSDGSGNVSWTWKVVGLTPAGSWPITVSCGSGSASTQITVS